MDPASAPPLRRFGALPVPARIGFLAGILAGAALVPVAVSVHQARTSVTVLGALTVLVGFLHWLSLPKGRGDGVRFDCTGVASIGALLIWGPAAAALPLLIATPVVDRLFRRQRLAWFDCALNSTWAVPGSLLGCLVLQAMAGNSFAPVAAGFAFLATNVAYVGGTLALEDGFGPRAVARAFAPFFWHDVQDVLLSALLWVAWERGHWFALCVPVLVAGQVRISRRSIRQVDAIQAAEEEAREQGLRARMDGLTGLANRRALEERLAGRLGDEGAVLLLDLDHFKTINDLYGHAAGDTALQAVADALQEVVRPGDLCARYGGEEFCVVLDRGSMASGEAVAVADRIRRQVAAIALAEHPDLALTVSLGVGVWTAPGTVRDALAQADVAVYRAKRQGRNTVCA